MATDNNIKQFPLHEKVFEGDIKEVSKLLWNHDVSQKDVHGNSPLHLAVMLGHKECVLLLLAHGAVVKIKNLQGWTPLAEAISYGDRQTITALVRKLRMQTRDALEDRHPALIKALQELGDFYLELKWDFHSWVPLVSRILPSDICKIHKKGSCIRMDTTLVDFKDMKWERGDISFLFNGDKKVPLVALDNKQKVFQRIRYEDAIEDIDGEVDVLMSSDIVVATIPTKHISFTRLKTGWVFREDKTEMVGNYKAEFHSVQGLMLDQHKRREHLSEEDLLKNKSMLANLRKGNLVENEDEFPRRRSLPSPPHCQVTWKEYITSPPGEHPPLGRPHVQKHNSKMFKATLAMSQDFPMSVKVMLDVLEVIAPVKQFSKLREFLQSKLPPGFPVKIELPVFPTVTAKVTFQQFAWENDIPDSKFVIPRSYREDRYHFPDL